MRDRRRADAHIAEAVARTTREHLDRLAPVRLDDPIEVPWLLILFVVTAILGILPVIL